MVEGFEDGVWWVELAPISDPGSGAGRSAVLGVHETPGRALTDAIVEDLTACRSCWSWTTASIWWRRAPTSPRPCSGPAPTFGSWLPAASRWASRARRNWPVPPLSTPDPRPCPLLEELERYEAVRLFVERAGCRQAGLRA